MIEIVCLYEGHFRRQPFETLHKAAETVYDLFMSNADGCEVLHSIRDNDVEVWKHDGPKSMAELFKLIYPEGTERSRRRSQYD